MAGITTHLLATHGITESIVCARAAGYCQAFISQTQWSQRASTAAMPQCSSRPAGRRTAPPGASSSVIRPASLLVQTGRLLSK
jgi:hypothetical protein